MGGPGEGVPLHQGRIGVINRQAHPVGNKVVCLAVKNENGDLCISHRPDGVDLIQVEAAKQPSSQSHKGIGQFGGQMQILSHLADDLLGGSIGTIRHNALDLLR